MQAARGVYRTATLRVEKYSTDARRARTGSACRRSHSYTTSIQVQCRRTTSEDRHRVLSIEQLHYVQSSTAQTHNEQGQAARGVDRTATQRVVKYSIDASRAGTGSACRWSHSYTTCRKVQYRRTTSEDRQRVPSVAQLHYVNPSTDAPRARTGSACRWSHSYTTCNKVQYRCTTSEDRHRVPSVAQLHYV